MNNAAPKSPGEAGWIARSACADMLVYLTASWVHKSVIEPEVRFRPSAKSHPEGFDQGLRSHFWRQLVVRGPAGSFSPDRNTRSPCSGLRPRRHATRLAV